MSSEKQVYSLDQEIISFFEEASATRSDCDTRAHELVGGIATPLQCKALAAILYTLVRIMYLWFNFG